jgi:S1-C subfamily serine protease
MRMKRFVSYLGILPALLLGMLILAFLGNTATNHSATNDASTMQNFSLASSSPASPSPISPEVTSATTTAQASATSVPSKKTTLPSPASATPAQPAAKPVSTPAPLTASESAALDASAMALHAALVNIICYAPEGSGLHSMSGSGVFIDPKGIILTNAHVAQYFLLADRGVSCVIRSGSPATERYSAALIYISPAWLGVNAGALTQVAPSGTGEYDFAFLAVNKSATSAPLPSLFPFIPLASFSSSAGAPVAIASYGAQFLESNQIQSALFPTIVFGSVKDVFTFATSTVDVLALGGSAAAQEGSSGGGVADVSGALVGTITTSTMQGATNTRSLTAITASYIRSRYAGETGRALSLLLAEPTATSIERFAPFISAFESILTAHLL